ncbi:hypothetical protein E4U41_000972 [Claviceps citrina]|nr:hypothetical protein E4U41_000972 [Claviceps citrina]
MPDGTTPGSTWMNVAHLVARGPSRSRRSLKPRLASPPHHDSTSRARCGASSPAHGPWDMSTLSLLEPRRWGMWTDGANSAVPDREPQEQQD